ncbi:MAG TPA: hypothetical protein VLI69_01015 [Gammaproteobacteria bacterium]|nr:hypothetical protein [Gammaproteobacteria bacterium]
MAASGSAFPKKEESKQEVTYLKSRLETLCSDTMQQIFRPMNDFKDQAHLASTNKCFYNFFQPRILNGIISQPSTHQQFLVNKLLNCLLENPRDLCFIEEQLEKNSALFLLEGSVGIPINSNSSGNTIEDLPFKGSPYQLTILQHDVHTAQTIQKNLCQSPQHREKIKKQLKRFFPEGYEATKIIKSSENKEVLLEIVKEIVASKASDAETLMKDCAKLSEILNNYLFSNLDESCIFSINLFLDVLELCTDEKRLEAFNYNADHYKARYFMAHALSLISFFVPSVYKRTGSFRYALCGDISRLPLLKTEVAETENLLTQLILDGESPAPNQVLPSQMSNN